MPEKLLILGGTREAYELAERLVSQFSPEQLTVISSLAGVTEHPRQPAGEVRIGGFSDTTGTGGKSGLQNYLLQEKIRYLSMPPIPMPHKSVKMHSRRQRNSKYPFCA